MQLVCLPIMTSLNWSLQGLTSPVGGGSCSTSCGNIVARSSRRSRTPLITPLPPSHQRYATISLDARCSLLNNQPGSSPLSTVSSVYRTKTPPDNCFVSPRSSLPCSLVSSSHSPWSDLCPAQQLCIMQAAFASWALNIRYVQSD